MLENASLTSEIMDQSLVPELTLWRRTAGPSKQLGVQHSSAVLYNSIQIGLKKVVCFLFVLCHSQDDPPALCQEMEKGIGGCCTLTKLSVIGRNMLLLPQCSSASVRAAMALQSSLTEVEWRHCDFYSKSDI